MFFSFYNLLPPQGLIYSLRYQAQVFAKRAPFLNSNLQEKEKKSVLKKYLFLNCDLLWQHGHLSFLSHCKSNLQVSNETS